MGTLTDLEIIVQSHATWINGVITNSKKVSELDDAQLPANAGDLLPISQSDQLYKITKGDLTGSQGIKYVESFTATLNQATKTVNAGVILDDGLWTVQVGSELWNSTNGITAFPEGNISINFASGIITFLIPLHDGSQVIIKHN